MAKEKLMKFGFAAVVLAGVVSWVLISATTAEELRIGDGCLRYDASLPRVNNRMLRHPLFRIPLASISPNTTAGKETDAIISIWRESSILHDALLAKTSERTIESCGKSSTDMALDAYRDNGATNCFIDERTIYRPTVSSDEFGAVRVTCDDNPTVPNCVLAEVYENGWKTETMFPRDLLPKWQEISDAVEEFFDANLTTCGE
jgi:hypothetical protein